MEKAQERLALLETLSKTLSLALRMRSLETADEEPLLGCFNTEANDDVRAAMGWALEDANLAVAREKKKKEAQASQQGEEEGGGNRPATPEPQVLSFSPFTSPATRSPPVNSPAPSSAPSTPLRMPGPGPQKMATLSGLPPELKILIVEKIFHLQRQLEDGDDDGFEDGESDSGDRTSSDLEALPFKRTPLFAISMVNKEFHQMAMVHIWANVDLSYRRSILDLTYFVHTLLPKYRHHIQSLLVSHSPLELEEEDEDDDELTDPLIAVRQCLLVLTVLLTPNISVPYFDFGRLPLTPSFSDALKIYGDQIIDMSITGANEVPEDEAQLAEIIRSFPNLKKLELEDFTDLSPKGRDELHSAITSLERLESLSLVTTPFATDDLANKDWKVSLKYLALSECFDLSFDGTLALIRKHAATLEGLDLDEIPSSINEIEKKAILRGTVRLALPKLENLIISTLYEKFILNLFSSCSLVELKIDCCPAIESSEWEGFITLHEKTIKKVIVSADSGWTEAQQESFEVWCYAKKIECEVEPDEGEDEEDYDMEGEFLDDDEGWSDEDDMDGDLLDDEEDEEEWS